MHSAITNSTSTLYYLTRWLLKNKLTIWPKPKCVTMSNWQTQLPISKATQPCLTAHSISSCGGCGASKEKLPTLHFNGHFPGGPGLAGTRMSPFWILLDLRAMEVVLTTEAIRRAKLLSKCHQQQTNTQFFLQPDALPVTQPTVSKHPRETARGGKRVWNFLNVFFLNFRHYNAALLPWAAWEISQRCCNVTKHGTTTRFTVVSSPVNYVPQY